jgi:SAM-dependent methyltransferase
MSDSKEIREAVKDNYAKVASENSTFTGCGCGPDDCCEPTRDHDEVSATMGYSAEELAAVPDGANLGLGCGNPQAIASIKEGETVLDLGSGAGFDAFLASRQVGKSGEVIGVDMTPEMISKARKNARTAGITNTQFKLGQIENLPLADNEVDVIISNCVINLSPEKQKVFNEAYRVLKPGGRIAVSDVVATADMPQSYMEDLKLHSACISGASTITALEQMLNNAGFRDIRIEPKDESKEFIRDWVPERSVADYVVSASIQAVKQVS